MIKILTPVFALALLSACQTTDLAHRQTLEQRTLAQQQRNHAAYAANTDVEPPSPAEGPDDVPEGPARDPYRNPALVPSPLLRYSAASSTP